MIDADATNPIVYAADLWARKNQPCDLRSLEYGSMSMPLVSIIIPCWNGEAFVGEAIESALAQTYPETEVIVIDDGSKDRSLDVIRSFGEQVRWKTGPNRGGCTARNLGLALARGELIQFLDADDCLAPEKLAIQVPWATDHPNSITYTDHICRWMDSSHQSVVRSRPVTDADPFVFVLHHRTLTVAAPLYWRSWLQAVGGFRNGLGASQEFEMNLRLAAHVSRTAATFMHVPEVLFEVRRRNGSVSSNTARTLALRAGYLPEIAENLDAQGELGAHRRAELAAYSAAVGRACLRGGQPTAGKRLIAFAERLDRHSAELRAWGTGARWCKRLFGASFTERLASILRGVRA